MYDRIEGRFVYGDDVYIPEEYLDEVWEYIPYDNDPSNLAWGTRRDNWDDSVRNGTARPPTDKIREKGFQKLRRPIIGTNLESGEIVRFQGQCEAERILGIQQANIWKVLNKERRQAGGWTFEYIERE